MKAKEFVTEAKKKADPYAAQGVTTGKSASAGKEIADFIKKNCKPWLSVSNNGNTRAYRGISTKGTAKFSAFLKATRQDRRPKDTSDESTRTFNAAIASLGGQANRTNSIFVTPDPDVAAAYGYVYVYIPVGNFAYTFSPYWPDWTEDVDTADFTELFNKDVIKLARDKARAATKAAAQLDMRTKLRAHASDYIKSVLLPNSNASDRKEYNAILKDPNQLDKFLKDFFDTKALADRLSKAVKPNLTDFLYEPSSYNPKKVSEWIYVNHDINIAFEKGVEIMIACEQGLYVHENTYNEYVLPLLSGRK